MQHAIRGIVFRCAPMVADVFARAQESPRPLHEVPRRADRKIGPGKLRAWYETSASTKRIVIVNGRGLLVWIVRQQVCRDAVS